MQKIFETRTLCKKDYPFLLKQISRLPDSMEMAGKLPSDDNKFLCVIGSRNNSHYGEQACEKLISGLQGYPIVIVSGLAIGIDSIAHSVALEAGLKTISFPGSGLSPSVLYPQSRMYLAKKIVSAGGALLSPFEPEQEGTNWTFPTRNRLMAGASHATLIIEAKRKSGTLITADYAAEFGRDILTVSGSIFSDSSYGPHMLVRRGATPVSCSEDILEALGFKVKRDDPDQGVLPNFAEMSLTPEEKKVVDHLRIESLSSGQLMEKIGYSPTQLNILISELELRGLIKNIDGKFMLA